MKQTKIQSNLKILTFTLIIFILIAFAYAQEDETTGSISGYVNPAIEGYIVYLKESGKTDYDNSYIIEVDGYYEFTNIKPGTYRVYIPSPPDEYYFYRWDALDIFANTNLTNLNLTLSPKNNSYDIDRIIIALHTPSSKEEVMKIAEDYGSLLMSYYSYSNHYSVSLPEGKTIEETIELYEADPRVENAYLSGYSSLGVIYIAGESSEENNETLSNISAIPSNVLVEEEVIQEGEIVTSPEEEISWFRKIIDFIKSLFV